MKKTCYIIGLVVTAWLLHACHFGDKTMIEEDTCKSDTTQNLFFDALGGASTITLTGLGRDGSIFGLDTDNGKEPCRLPTCYSPDDSTYDGFCTNCVAYNDDFMVKYEYRKFEITGEWFTVTNERTIRPLTIDVSTKPNDTHKERKFRIGVISGACSSTVITVTQYAE
jgi:hypothetical protein